MNYTATTTHTFFRFYEHARRVAEHIRAATSPAAELQDHHPDASWYIASDHQSGFGVAPDGILLGVWSLVRGRGPELLDAAI